MANFAIPLGIGLVTSIGSALLQPIQEGPRLDDLTFPKSDWGQQIPRVWGRMRLGGNVIWATDLEENRRVTKLGKGGGKGGGGFGKNAQYEYTANLAVLLCQGPQAGVSRIWINRELKYDVSPEATDDSLSRSIDWANDFLAVYLGTPTQPRDALIESRMGTNATPAYRHRVYLVFEDIPAEGNIQIEAEVYSACSTSGGRLTPQAVPLSQIVQALTLEADLLPEQFETTDLNTVQVDGFFIQSPAPTREAISQLMQAYFFDAIETGRGVRYQLKNRPTVENIAMPLDRLACYQYGDTRPRNFRDKQTDSGQLLKELSLTFLNPENNYERDVVRQFRQNSPNSDSRSIDLPIVLPKATAQAICDRYLFEQWIARRSIAFTCGPRYLGVEPGDLLSLDPYGNGPEIMQVNTRTDGANFVTELEAKPYANSFPILGGLGGNGRSLEVSAPGIVTIAPLDIPLLKDTDPDYGLTIVARGQRFRGCDIYLSRDNGVSYRFARRIFAETVQGVTLTPLLGTNAPLNQTDTISTVDVRVYAGELESVSEERFLAGENFCLIGNELIWFRTATLISANTYRLQGLRRGRRGTDRFRFGHVTNERFVLLNNYYSQIQLQPADFGKTLHFKALADGQALTEVSSVSLNYQAVTQRTYSPQAITATKNPTTGDISIGWSRRDRRAGEREDYNFLPLSESQESYQLTVRSTSAAVRTVTQATTNYIYTQAQQIADFGSARGAFTVEVRQQSALVGWGSSGVASFNL